MPLCDEGCTLELEKSVIFQIVMSLLIDISARLGYGLPVASSEDFLEMLHIFTCGAKRNASIVIVSFSLIFCQVENEGKSGHINN